MQTQALVEIALAVQLTLVGLFLLRAVARSLHLRRTAALHEAVHGVTQGLAHADSASSDPSVEHATEVLAALRREHAAAEEEFSARRRAALLEMRDHQRRTAELAAEERELEEHVLELRTEVRHFEQRHVALTAEIRAALESSELLRDRSATARRQLGEIQAESARLRTRFAEDADRLRDLTRRRTLLRAETEELSELLELLQQLAGEPVTMTGLTDGELRERAAAALDDAARSGPKVAGRDRAPVTDATGRIKA